MSWINIDGDDRYDEAPLGSDHADNLRRQVMDIMQPMLKRARDDARQEALRERYPALREAWENYHMVLRLIEGEADAV